MAGMQSLIGGLVGAAVGVVVWVLVGYITHFEVGWIAWAVGFLAGVGVRFGGSRNGGDANFEQGALAAVLAIAAILTAKYIVFSLLVAGQVVDSGNTLTSIIPQDADGIIAGYAEEAAAAALDRGETIAWPPGVTVETASAKRDYPPEIWQQAERRWQQLGPQKQAEKIKMRQMLVAADPIETTGPSFREEFSLFDLLWFALALMTALKVGGGGGADGRR